MHVLLSCQGYQRAHSGLVVLKHACTQNGSHLKCRCVCYVRQTCVQGVLEGLVLLDRCVYLWELGLKAEAVPLFDEDISPRCVAVMATRTHTWNI